MAPAINAEELLDNAEKLHRQATDQAEPAPEFIALDFEPVEAPRPGRDRRERDGWAGFGRNRYSVEREENDDRRARRSRDLAEDDDMKGTSDDKGSTNGSVRSRRRSRSPNSDRRAPRSSRDRDYRQRDRLDRSGGDYYHGSGRPSSRDDDYYRPGREEYRGPRGRGGRDRSPPRHEFGRRESHRSDYRGSRRRSQDLPKKKSPEPNEERDSRLTIFASQLAARLEDRKLKTFFEKAGRVVAAEIVRDKYGRSKGVGYVTFVDEASVQKAIGLTGQKLMGMPIIAGHTEAEKNRQARTTTNGTGSNSNASPGQRLYVGNIDFSITESDLKDIFEPFGELEFVRLVKTEEGRSRGHGFVQFVNKEHAEEAKNKMNNFELANREIRVSNETAPQHQAQKASFQGSAFSGMGGRGAHAGGSTANFDRAGGRDANKTGGASALDDTDVTGVNLSNFSRDSLMRKLARTDEPEQKIAPKIQQKPAPIEEQPPSRCIVVRNMFSQADEERKTKGTKADWKQDVIDDTREECTAHYGVVVHIDLGNLDNDVGDVFMKFDRVEGGRNAVVGLNGRTVEYRRINASYVADHIYNSYFPKAKNL